MVEVHHMYETKGNNTDQWNGWFGLISIVKVRIIGLGCIITATITWYE